jgi:hypothetical protein
MSDARRRQKHTTRTMPFFFWQPQMRKSPSKVITLLIMGGFWVSETQKQHVRRAHGAG